MKYAEYIDYTNLKANATTDDIKKICDDAIKYHFASVCVNPCYVSLAKELLDDTPVNVCTVVGFPLGANTIRTKEMEALIAVEDGADEIDMVINIGAIKNGDYYESTIKGMNNIVFENMKNKGVETLSIVFK